MVVVPSRWDRANQEEALNLFAQFQQLVSELIRDDAAHEPTTKVVRALGMSSLYLNKGLSLNTVNAVRKVCEISHERIVSVELGVTDFVYRIVVPDFMHGFETWIRNAIPQGFGAQACHGSWLLQETVYHEEGIYNAFASISRPHTPACR